MTTISRSDDLTIPELFHALKQRLCGISSNYISNSSGLALKEVISLQTEASDVLSLVQGLRNLSSPVCRLPGEVLERIFVMRALEQDLLAASRVCRHWRETLISAPHLWTKLQCIGVARTLQYLARSEPVPVHVIGDFDSDIQAVIALKSATDRFGSLTLRLQPFDLLQVFRQLVSPAHALEHLEILAAPHFGDGPTFRPTIPATFLGGSTPALKSFHLNGINTKLNFSEFPALTRLNVVTNVQTFDMSELFQVFTSAKLLEEVSVQSCGPTTPIAESQDVIRLPRVKKLSFSSTVGEFPKRLLSLLVMPSVEEVKLDINLHGEDTGTMRDFLPARLQNFPHLLKVGSLKLDVPQAHCNIQFGGPGGVVSIHALRSGNREQNDGFQTHWLNSLEPMSITDVKDLTLRSYHPEESLDRCPVFKTLKALDGLRSLAVERCNNAILIKALAPTKERSILFPHLEILTFQLTTEPTTVFPGLTDVAQERSRARFPLSKVASDRYSTFRRSDVDALQRHVNCAQLNTIANSRFNEPVNVPAFSIVTVRI
ncbi:hypothetical protein BDM02DRAFT_3186227 [Thelephora ganbajun]|uniref:Uncharacterized protein n=1 Tax=Thelephora ganbajun TaxID=370292 RepID=A0ACB6ZI54_THEGA|nr:hypothetical protein BDM02DRAFT_3186227 [Thelephora ganbajun]